MSKKLSRVYNPFEKIAGWKAFGIGILILCVTTVLGYFTHAVFFGISIKLVDSVTWCRAFSLQFLGLGVTVAVMYLIALLAAKRVRFQDILGTVTLAKYPLILTPFIFWIFGGRTMEISDRIIQTIQTNPREIVNILTISDYAVLMGFSVLSLAIAVWTIALLFHAFRVSTNLKGAKCGLLFTAIALISEIIINVVISVIY